MISIRRLTIPKIHTVFGTAGFSFVSSGSAILISLKKWREFNLRGVKKM